MIIFLESSKNDIEELNNIAFFSESYWGHNKDMMEIFRREYSLTQDYLKDNRVFNMVLDGIIIGFYALNMTHETPELEYFYLKPEYIGKGYGRKLWNNAIEFCKKNKIEEFIFVAGAEVRNYYLKMGAEEIKTLSSKLDARRKIYAFKMTIKVD
jgi:GNAT superfamily N-acetyltransferase